MEEISAGKTCLWPRRSATWWNKLSLYIKYELLKCCCIVVILTFVCFSMTIEIQIFPFTITNSKFCFPFWKYTFPLFRTVITQSFSIYSGAGENLPIKGRFVLTTECYEQTGGMKHLGSSLLLSHIVFWNKKNYIIL